MKDTLEKCFRAPLMDYYKRRIIVWKDEEGEFADTVAEMTLENARILTMRKDCLFEIRRQIEVDYAEENLLIYCPMAFERVQDNWLLDVFLYGEEFRADYWSLLFTELNIENTRPVREYARSVSAFFASRERRGKLAALREGYANEQELQTGIFDVLCGAKTYGIAAAVRAVLSCDPDEENPCLTAIEKFCGADAFWQAMEDAYGYSGARQAERLACHLLTTAAMHTAEGQSLAGLPCNGAFAPQAFALFADWQRSDAEGLLGLCQRIEERFDVERALSQWNLDVLLRLSVFPVVDRLLIEPTLFSFAEGRFNIDDAETLLHARQDQAWAAHYQAYYRVVQALVHMQRFYLAYRGGFHYTSLSEAWEAYRKELYRMDQDYRLFCTAHDAALDCGILALEDSLRAASDAVERLYKNWYLTELNEVWVQLISVQGVDSLRQAARQMDFYQTHVASQANRVYVVISDALRYEVAQELAQQMAGKLNGNTQCEAMVGTLPGITPVGMAALLPHGALTMDYDLRLRCDGLSAEAPNRERILQAACAESVAVNYLEFRQCTKAQRTELVRGKKVVYIYHDSIDRAGESDANVFDACGEAIQELSQLMRILVHELSAATVFITADHGFLYTRSPLEEYEKAGKELIQGEMLEYKRRHAIVRGEGKDRMTVSIPLAQLGRPELTAVFPRGCMRFRLQGGASAYMHGGLSLQEMALPLIRYQNKKAGQKGFQTITKTEILLLGDNRKISNNIFTLMFFQKEPCAGKVQPRTVLARFEDASGAIISDEHRIIGNMTATENSQRTVRTTFRLLGSGYDRTHDYALVLIDPDEKREMVRIPFKVDIVFENDFDFQDKEIAEADTGASFNITGGKTMDTLDRKIVEHFPGKIVRKDLTSMLKRGANVPTFVLEYLLGMYCATDDEAAIATGVEKIRKVLTENYVRPEESEKIKSLIRERGEYTIIDKVSAHLDEYNDYYVARFANLEIEPFLIQSEYAVKYTKILMGGIWCIARISYTYKEDSFEDEKRKKKKRGPEDSPFRITSLKPIQLPNLNLDDIISQRQDFSTEEWMDVLLRSEGLEPSALSEKEKLHFLERMVPLVEHNYNLCELGPRGTGKSHLYKEISPYSILMSGGQTTTANLFYSLSARRVGLVGHWDCVAFDEVAGMHFRDQDAIQIMKDYMASGSFARGRDMINADASMVFVGNINDSVQNLLKVTHLFSPFPPEFNNDSAFFDRMHYYLPGWEIPKMRSELLTEKYGLITDCLAEFTRGMRRMDFTHVMDEYFRLNSQFNKRDEIAVRKTMSGLTKLLFPDQQITKEETEWLLKYAIEGRRRVKEQLKIMAGIEFADVGLGYLDLSGEETVVSVSEQSATTLVPAERLPSGHVFAIGASQLDGDMAVYRLENKAVSGTGKMDTQGIGQNRPLKESMEAAWRYFLANAKKVLPGVQLANHDYLLYYDDTQSKGRSTEVSVAEFVGLCSALVDRPVIEACVIVGEIKLSGTMGEVQGLENIIRVAKNAGARRVMLPMQCMRELMQVSGELLSTMQPLFYMDPVDAVKKALDVF